jgi:CyaY protein
MDEARFDLLADQTLRRILGALDALDVEAELELGVLKISFEDGPDYVVNSHRAARQIWMAAEREAWHFDPDLSTGRWTASKSGDELWSALERVLSKKLGRGVTLRS